MAKTYDIEFSIRRLVCERTRAYVAAGGRINKLAKKTGLAGQTISRLAYMETQHPRFHTVIALCAALDIRLIVDTGEREMSDGLSNVVSLSVSGNGGR